MNLPLSFSPIAATSTSEDTERLFRDQFVSSRITKAKPQDSFGVEMNGILIGDCSLSVIHHKADYDIDCGEVENQNSILFGFSSGSPSSTTLDGREVCTNDHGVVITKHSKLNHRRSGNSYEFVLGCSGDALDSRLQTLLGRYTSRHLTFDQSISMKSASGSHVKATMSYILSSLDANPALLNNEIVLKGFEALLLDSVILIPSNYSEQLKDPGKVNAIPGIVKRAESFIEDNAHMPITMAEILHHCDCSRSALFKNFRRFRGYTPLEFLTTRRLDLVHRRLVKAESKDNVSPIAQGLGFTHMGRFSIIYRKRFGEKPSETLRRGSWIRGGFGPGSKVQSGKSLKNPPLTPIDLPNRPTPGSAYTQSRLPRPTPSEKADILLQVTTQKLVRASDS